MCAIEKAATVEMAVDLGDEEGEPLLVVVVGGLPGHRGALLDGELTPEPAKETALAAPADYSARSASAGSTWVARRAGTTVAASATSVSSIVTAR